MKRKLIYVMDAQCGWCYGNSDNITALYKEFMDSLEFELVSGGMWLGDRAPKAGPTISRYIESQLPRLQSHTGVAISEAYRELIAHSDYTLSSLEPSAALVWVKTLAEDNIFAIAKDIQLAYFGMAKRLDQADTYLEIFENYAIDRSRFSEEWLSPDNLNKTYKEFQRASSLANGFPSLILQEGDQSTMLASGYFNLDEMRKRLTTLY